MRQLKKKVVISFCMGEHCGWPRCEQPWWHKGFVASSKRDHYVLGDGQLPSFFDSQKKLVFSTSHEHIHVILVTDQLNAKNYCFIISLLYSSTCFEYYVLIIRRYKLYYTASGIITLKQVYYTPLQVSSTVVLIIRRSKLCYSASGIITLKRVYYMPLHVSSTICSPSGGQNCIIQHLVSSHSVGGRPVHRLREDCARDCHL